MTCTGSIVFLARACMCLRQAECCDVYGKCRSHARARGTPQAEPCDVYGDLKYEKYHAEAERGDVYGKCRSAAREARVSFLARARICLRQTECCNVYGKCRSHARACGTLLAERYDVYGDLKYEKCHAEADRGDVYGKCRSAAREPARVSEFSCDV